MALNTIMEFDSQALSHKSILVMGHHNVIEHLPGQASHELGRRYMLANANVLLELLHRFGVKLIFTGHLHVQDVAESQGIYEITTGSLVSYPHPYRVLELTRDSQGKQQLQIESFRIESVPEWDNLLEVSRNWMGDRSHHFMLKLLTTPPLNLPIPEAQKLVPQLRYFWADIAAGDAIIEFPDFPPQIHSYFQQFGVSHHQGSPRSIDNNATIVIS